MRVLDPAHLDPVRLGSAVAAALLRAEMPATGNGAFEYDGASRAAARLLGLARWKRARSSPDPTPTQLPL